MIEVTDVPLQRDHFPQPLLPPKERKVAEILAVHGEEIEGIKEGDAAAVKQRLEDRAALGVQTDYFPIQHGAFNVQLGEGAGKGGEGLVDMAGAGDEAGSAGFNKGEGAKTIVFSFFCGVPSYVALLTRRWRNTGRRLVPSAT